jgi:hypothetical protein
VAAALNSRGQVAVLSSGEINFRETARNSQSNSDRRKITRELTLTFAASVDTGQQLSCPLEGFG